MIEHKFKPPKSNHETEKVYYFSADYTDHRCDAIARKMRKIISEMFPKFLLRVSFKSIKLENFIHKRLKHQFDDFDKSGLVYQFSCVCHEKYIGETMRTLKVRSNEHATSDKNSAIFHHIRSCPKFLERFNEYWSEPNANHSKLSHNKMMGLFTPQFFSVLNPNLPFLRDRKIAESIYIKLYNPSLNIKHSMNENNRKPWNLSLPL